MDIGHFGELDTSGPDLGRRTETSTQGNAGDWQAGSIF